VPIPSQADGFEVALGGHFCFLLFAFSFASRVALGGFDRLKALPGVSQELPRSLTVVPLIPDQRYYGEAPASIRASKREWAARMAGAAGPVAWLFGEQKAGDRRRRFGVTGRWWRGNLVIICRSAGLRPGALWPL
jgi:hypothetical protein